MTLSTLVLSPHGRIGRRKWLVCTFAVALTSRLIAAIPAGFDTGTTANIASTLLLLNFWFAPAYSLAAKRFQDRGKPGRTALYGLVPMVGAMLIWNWVFFPIRHEPGFLGLLCGLVEWGTQLWFLIELGMMKGDSGANRFGPDPYDSSQAPAQEDARPIENPVFAYTVSAAGAAIMAAACNSLIWVLSLPGTIPLLALVDSGRRAGEMTLLSTIGVWVIAASCSSIGFLLATPFARLALRMWPADPFRIAAVRRVMVLAVAGTGALTAAGYLLITIVGVTRYASQYVAEPYYGDLTYERELQHAIVRCGWGGALFGVFFIFCWAHVRAGAMVNQPFTLFLRRFSTFADRSLVVDLMKSMPGGVRLVFIASRADHAGNWDPFVWAFGGLRLFRPLRNLPLQVRTSDDTWIETVRQLVQRAQCIVLDVSASSPSITIEKQLIQQNEADGRVVLLEQATGARPVASDSRAIRYSPTLWGSAGRTVIKVGIVLAVWLRNPGELFGWLALLAMPILVTRSVSSATRQAIRTAVRGVARDAIQLKP